MRNLIAVFLGIVGAAAAIILPQQFHSQSAVSTLQPTTTAVATSQPALTFTAPTAVPTLAPLTHLASYPNLGPAAELRDSVWLNSKTPLRLADLRGQVVMLEFWTFECINCLHVLPYIRQWYATYHDQGLTVIGIHYPEFSYEADYNNLVAAVKRLGIAYPVAQDNDGATWDAYGQRYWPTLYLIDKRGNIRYEQIGEGGYPQTENAIQALLAES